MRRFILALALLCSLPLAAEAQRPRGLNLEVGLDKVLVIPISTATSQTNALVLAYTPGYTFRIISVKTYTRVVAGTVTGQLRVGTDTTTVLDSALTFTNTTEYNGRIKVTARTRSYGSASQLRVYYTSDGSGELTNGFIVIRIKPL